MRNEKTMLLKQAIMKKKLDEAEAQIELLELEVKSLQAQLEEKESKTRRKTYKKKIEKEEE